MSALSKRLLSFKRDNRGVVGVIFGLSLLPMLGMVGAAIDYSATARVRAGLRSAADAAVLAAARAYVDEAPDDATDTAAVLAAKAKANAKGQLLFSTNATQVIAGASVSIATTVSNLTVTSTAYYSGSSPTYFTKILGFPDIDLSGSVKASITLPRYRNVYVAIDISQSMGIGATETDMDKLASLTPDSCIFGCHTAREGDEMAYSQLARLKNVTLRIDVVKKATQNMIASANSIATDKNIKFAIYTMQFDDLTRLASLSSDYTNALATAAGKIDLGPSDPGGPGDSDLAAPLASLTNIVPASGDGKSAANPQNFVFIMTDGVRDVYNATVPWGHAVSAFDDSWCAALKNKGVTVGVIYTTYFPIDQRTAHDQAYNDLVKPIIGQVQPNLESCASTGYYFEAQDGPEIEQKVAELFKKAVGGTLALSR
ncbi:pilus assembly protein TadG-related protein [Methylocystis sp. IM3]|jgi:Flp pilus assembly protein TadG|uniref:TadE/TadG family type IV pilus assembly protein n=1 Tax=unclassified Methylocystis TaxID=2625913 RepID=UPI0030FCC061